MAYEMKSCSVCGAGLPVNGDEDVVTCQFCGAEYDVVRRGQAKHARAVDRQLVADLQSAAVGFLIGGIGGFIIGGLIFTPYGRSLGIRTVERGARAVGISSRR